MKSLNILFWLIIAMQCIMLCVIAYIILYNHSIEKKEHKEIQTTVDDIESILQEWELIDN